MKQVFTLVEFEYNREVLPTEIQAAITKLLGAYPVRVEAAQQSVQADVCRVCGQPMEKCEEYLITGKFRGINGTRR